MKDLLLTLLHLTVMTATLCGRGGVRAVIAENLLLKQQLIVLRRPRQRAPRLTASDRLLFGFGSLFLSPGRIRKVAIGVRPSTLLALHQALVRRTYRRLFSSSECPKKPGPKGPSEALIQAIVELKSRNPRFGCPRIARIIARTFGANIDKNVVYRVLSTHSRPTPGGTGPSWVSFIGHTTDSLWSVDLCRGESIVLRSNWVLVVMDQFTRRLVGVRLEFPILSLNPGLRQRCVAPDVWGRRVAGGGAAAIVEEAGRHAGRLTGGAPRRAPAEDGDAVAVEDPQAIGITARQRHDEPLIGREAAV